MLFKRRKIKTVFDLPIEESKVRLNKMSNNIYAIVESPKFAEIASKIPVPVSATQKDIDAMLKQYAPKKVKDILSFILEDNFENIIGIIAELFCSTYDEYKNKSLNEIAEDLSRLTKSEVKILLNFIRRAGK